MPTLHAGKDPDTDRFRQVKLTHHQLEKLGFQRDEDPKKLGCGTMACAYLPENSDSVVKLTTDPRDALVSWMIMNYPGGTPSWAIPIYGVWWLPEKAYVICAAKGEPLTEEWIDAIDTIYDYTADVDLRAEEWPELRGEITRRLDDDETARGPTEASRIMRKALGLIDEAVQAFAQLGLDWADFHSGNFLMYSGRPVVVDFGLSRAKNEPDVPELQERGLNYPELTTIPALPL